MHPIFSVSQNFRLGFSSLSKLEDTVLVLIGQGGLSPFSSQRREAEAWQGATQEGGVQRVWDKGRHGVNKGLKWGQMAGVQPGGQPQPHRQQPSLAMVQALSCKNKPRVQVGLAQKKEWWYGRCYLLRIHCALGPSRPIHPDGDPKG